ncbi:MAG: nuclear transport factor 2 family protein [Oscillospiraceae bacterium]|nr:nuclear transport factor 2 family protein [Oscillospiraceae bacterium]
MDVKKQIEDLYHEVFNGGDAEAAAKYLAPGYRQHNPGVADGLDGFIRTFGAAFASGKQFNLAVLKVIEGEGYAAVLIGNERNPDGALVDIYRLDENGKFCEHWDIFGGR